MLKEIYDKEGYKNRKFTLLIDIDLNESEQEQFWDYVKKYDIRNINDHVKEVLIGSKPIAKQTTLGE